MSKTNSSSLLLRGVVSLPRYLSACMNQPRCGDLGELRTPAGSGAPCCIIAEFEMLCGVR